MQPINFEAVPKFQVFVIPVLVLASQYIPFKILEYDLIQLTRNFHYYSFTLQVLRRIITIWELFIFNFRTLEIPNDDASTARFRLSYRRFENRIPVRHDQQRYVSLYSIWRFVWRYVIRLAKNEVSTRSFGGYSIVSSSTVIWRHDTM